MIFRLTFFIWVTFWISFFLSKTNWIFTLFVYIYFAISMNDFCSSVKLLNPNILRNWKRFPEPAARVASYCFSLFALNTVYRWMIFILFFKLFSNNNFNLTIFLSSFRKSKKNWLKIPVTWSNYDSLKSCCGPRLFVIQIKCGIIAEFVP